MGNNTSTTTRKSTAGVRLSSGSARRTLRKETDLDEEFSDLILHEVTKQQQKEHQVSTDVNGTGHSETLPNNQGGSVWGNVTGTRAYSSRALEGEQSQQQRMQQTTNHVVGENNGKRRRKSSAPYKQFLNDLIEDEFNELNDGLLESEVPELSLNILPDNYVKEEQEDIEDGETKDTEEDQGVVGDIEMEDTESAEYKKVGLSVVKPIRDGDDDSFSPTPDLSKVDFTKIVPQQQQEQQSNHVNVPSPPPASGALTPNTAKRLIPVEIKWVNATRENIIKISIIGSFSNWRDVIRLKPSEEHPNEYATTINLPLGVHKLLYIINNEYRVSDQLPTATDQEGIFFNWFEVLDDFHLFNHSQNQNNHIGASSDYDANIIQTAGRYEVDRIQKKSTSFLAQVTKTEQPDFEHIEYQEDISETLAPPAHNVTAQLSETPPKYVSYQDEKTGSFFTEKVTEKLNYTGKIPEMFLNYDYFKSKGDDYQLPEPPQLPAHLNNVLLNKMSNLGPNPTFPHSHSRKSAAAAATAVAAGGGGLVGTDPFKPPAPLFAQDSSKRPQLRRADSSYYASNQEAYHLSIPNHVILNHLMTTSIRNDVLTVACITRYSGKFVTQIMHSPADNHPGPKAD